MRKSTNFCRLFLILGAILLLIVAAGCGEANVTDPTDAITDPTDATTNPTDAITDPTDPIKDPADAITGETNDRLMDKNISFCAETYAQDSILSSAYSLDIQIADGKIYVNDVLYEVSSAVPPEISYSEHFLMDDPYPPNQGSNAEIMYILTVMKNCEPSYVWETDQGGWAGPIISVYKINGVYYFVRFYDSGEVMRIHGAFIQEEKLMNASFCAETYTQEPSLSWAYSLDIEITDGKIYINDVLYEESPLVPPAIVYGDGFLGFAAYEDEQNGNTDRIDTLMAIQNAEPCYLWETDQSLWFGQIISVYKIDGIYYFIRFSDSGKVSRIHSGSVQ